MVSGRVDPLLTQHVGNKREEIGIKLLDSVTLDGRAIHCSRKCRTTDLVAVVEIGIASGHLLNLSMLVSR